MSFGWPSLLWLLALLPLLALTHGLALRRRRRAAGSYPSVAPAGTNRDAVTNRGPGGASRRWLPPALLLLALAALLVGLARPSAVVSLPAPHDVVVLAIDISGSMRATDIEPDRITAARTAAREFVERQPAGTRIGVVAFAAAASLVQPPTHDRQAILAAIDRLELQEATAIGSGLLLALKAIEPELRFDLRAADPRADPRQWPAPVAPGSNRSAAIVLLSDGESSTGPEPEVAARIVAERGVRVYTVGLGTPGGTVLRAEGWSMRVRLDEPTLRKLADLTLGEYFAAADAEQLVGVYRALDLKLAFERQRMEVTGLFALAAALLVALSAGLSLWWSNRVF